MERSWSMAPTLGSSRQMANMRGCIMPNFKFLISRFPVKRDDPVLLNSYNDERDMIIALYLYV
jgi:hypothetical protein